MAIFVVFTGHGVLYAAYYDKAVAMSIAAANKGRVEETILL